MRSAIITARMRFFPASVSPSPYLRRGKPEGNSLPENISALHPAPMSAGRVHGAHQFLKSTRSLPPLRYGRSRPHTFRKTVRISPPPADLEQALGLPLMQNSRSPSQSFFRALLCSSPHAKGGLTSSSSGRSSPSAGEKMAKIRRQIRLSSYAACRDGRSVTLQEIRTGSPSVSAKDGADIIVAIKNRNWGKMIMPWRHRLDILQFTGYRQRLRDISAARCDSRCNNCAPTHRSPEWAWPRAQRFRHWGFMMASLPSLTAIQHQPEQTASYGSEQNQSASCHSRQDRHHRLGSLPAACLPSLGLHPVPEMIVVVMLAHIIDEPLSCRRKPFCRSLRSK